MAYTLCMFSWFKKLGIIILVLFLFAGIANMALAEECADPPCGPGGLDNPSLDGGNSTGGSQIGNGSGSNGAVGGGNSGSNGAMGGVNANGSSGGSSGSNGAVGGGKSDGGGRSEPGNNGGDNNNGGNSGGNGGNGGGNRGGSSGSTPAVPATKIEGCKPGELFNTSTGKSCTVKATPATPGQVLGAEKFNFTKFLKFKAGSYKFSLQGNEVIELQKLLTSLGYDLGTADGKFGPKTKGAVIKFQIANGLKGDGVIGALTRAALNK